MVIKKKHQIRKSLKKRTSRPFSDDIGGKVVTIYHIFPNRYHFFIKIASENPFLCLPAGRQGRGRKMRLLKAEKSQPDAETSSA